MALLSKGSFSSAICRAEQMRALRKGVSVVPLLAQSEADRPLYLEEAHYLDFSSPDGYASGFRKLLDWVAAGRGVRQEDLPPRYRKRIEAEDRALPEEISAERPDWAKVLSQADEQTNRFIAELTGSARRPGPFIPELFVHRPNADRELGKFLDSEALGMLLVGDSGAGKTTLLSRWALDFQAARDIVLIYGGASLLDPKPGAAIARDLNLTDGSTLPALLDGLDGLAAENGRRVVLIFDAVNEFRGASGEGPELLLRQIDALLRRLSGRNVRVLASCSVATWSHLDRSGVLDRLEWSRIHQANGDPRPFSLGAFTAEELEQAYAGYQDYFGLRTEFAEVPAPVRQLIREPFLLRLLAESHRGRDEPITTATIESGIFRSYFQQKVRQQGDRIFLNELAAQMLMQGRAVLNVQELAGHDVLGPEILSEEPDSSYRRLLDEGILTETQGDLFVPDTVQVAYPLIGAYALAMHLLQLAEPVEAQVASLMERVDTLPPAWDTAQMILSQRGDAETFAALAGSTSAADRELAAESLRKLHAFKPEEATSHLEALLQGDSAEARRTALRAAYNIGPGARDLFLQAALQASTDLRDAAKETLYLVWRLGSPGARREAADTLYLLWRQDPLFTYDLLRELLKSLELRHPWRLGRALEFILDLSITIYISHCERTDVIEQTADLYQQLAVDRLHLSRLKLGSTLERLVFRVVARVASRPILNWWLFSGAAPVERFFDIPTAERNCLERIAPALDPRAEVATVADELRTMLGAQEPAYRGAAALVLAVQSCADFASVGPLHRRLFGELDARGRLWQLLSFAVLWPETPREWTPLLEELTESIVGENPEVLEGLERELLPDHDLALVPLGLAYAKGGGPVRLFGDWIEDGRAGGDVPRAMRTIAAFGPVGFYYPESVLAALQAHVPDLLEGELATPLKRTLAIVRMIVPDRVDALLAKAGAPPALHREIAAQAELGLVRRFIYLLGLYNNAVHFSLFYPKMRRRLSAGAFELLATAESPTDFIVPYTEEFVRMFREAEFDLRRWTEPEGE